MAKAFSNDRPIYLQLVEEIEQAILTGQYGPNQKLPSVREFAAIYQVNPNTMQKALQELEKKKLMYTERTNGKFVSENCSLIEDVRQKQAHQIVAQCIKDLNALGLSAKDAIELLKKENENGEIDR